MFEHIPTEELKTRIEAAKDIQKRASQAVALLSKELKRRKKSEK